MKQCIGAGYPLMIKSSKKSLSTTTSMKRSMRMIAGSVTTVLKGLTKKKCSTVKHATPSYIDLVTIFRMNTTRSSTVIHTFIYEEPLITNEEKE